MLTQRLSTLHQLHNPYTATPLSIAAYRMASSPSDTHGSRNVIQWLERLQQSAANQPGAGMGAKAARTLEKRERRRGREGNGEESESEEEEMGREPDVSVDVGADPTHLAPPSVKPDPEAGTVSETLRQSDSLPDYAVPIGLLANLSITNRRERSRARSAASGRSGRSAQHEGDANESGEDGDDNNVGVANEMYFLSGPASDLDRRKKLIERHSPPEILVHGLVNAEDVEKLFEM